MASLTFRIHYATQWGENLFLEQLISASKERPAESRVLPMNYIGEGFWSIQVEAPKPCSTVQYRYEFHDPEGKSRREPVYRRLEVVAAEQVVWDHFLAPELPDGAFLRQAFVGVIFNPARTAADSLARPGERLFRITIRASRVSAGRRVCVSGAHPLLGNWDPMQVRVMSSLHYPLWELDLPADQFTGPVEFKFGLCDENLGRLIEFEQGSNRIFHGTPPGSATLAVNYEQYRHPDVWRGAGVAISVFSLRTESGYGIGEFTDLAPFAQWAAGCHLHLVQLLPVNDTTSDFTWKDSYPYKAISTAALHPIYLNIEQLCKDCGVPLPEDYAARRAELNRLPQLDYEAVLEDKLRYLRDLFGMIRDRALASAEFRRFLREQQRWLVPYAAFCRLRDLYGTADFTQWGKHAKYRSRQIRTWFTTSAVEYVEVMFHCWAQFQLDRQLTKAVAAGHAVGVAFKGDLAIGVDRSSVEVWTEPDLFRVDRQTGAPPDAFAMLGQNWGFPTYNWARMEADGYAWWRKRFRRMAAGFDALRIDHILGFFRIWEIPIAYREGIMGHYNPALPLSREEIANAGFTRDPRANSAGTKPNKGLAENFEVLFLEDPDQPDRFHPRINLADTAIFRSLPEQEQTALRRLHDDYYFRRHTKFWADEAMKKLPALMDASPMLLCGEDLGMVPDSVPIVLKQLGLLSLEVQRWPKRLGQRFGSPADYPYLSVCTTSTHDMSTIRGWWEEETETRQHFWKDVMKQPGPAPAECSTEICRFVVEQNLVAASMWCILPLQDWLGIDARLRHPGAAEERINVPAIPRYYWRYRMQLNVEDLQRAQEFSAAVAELVQTSGRTGSE